MQRWGVEGRLFMHNAKNIIFFNDQINTNKFSWDNVSTFIVDWLNDFVNDVGDWLLLLPLFVAADWFSFSVWFLLWVKVSK